MNDTDLDVVRSDNEAKVLRLQDARDQTHDAPRIKQHLEAEASDRLLVLCGGQSRPALASVVLDQHGRHWSLERKPDSILKLGDPSGVIWRRLWLPPLPDWIEGES